MKVLPICTLAIASTFAGCDRKPSKPSEITGCPDAWAQAPSELSLELPIPQDPAEVERQLVATIAMNGRKSKYDDAWWTLVEVTPRLLGLAAAWSVVGERASYGYRDSLIDAQGRLTRRAERVFIATVSVPSRMFSDGVSGVGTVRLINQSGDVGTLKQGTPTLLGAETVIKQHEQGVLYLDDVVRPCDATFTVSFFEEPDATGERANFTFDATRGKVVASIAARSIVRDSNGTAFWSNERVSASGLTFVEAANLMLQVAQLGVAIVK